MRLFIPKTNVVTHTLYVASVYIHGYSPVFALPVYVLYQKRQNKMFMHFRKLCIGLSKYKMLGHLGEIGIRLLYKGNN